MNVHQSICSKTCNRKMLIENTQVCHYCITWITMTSAFRRFPMQDLQTSSLYIFTIYTLATAREHRDETLPHNSNNTATITIAHLSPATSRDSQICQQWGFCWNAFRKIYPYMLGIKQNIRLISFKRSKCVLEQSQEIWCIHGQT